MARPANINRTVGSQTDRDVIPLYHRVYVILLQKILDGSYPVGASMPSEDELGEAFGVSRVTIRKAMDRLEREGRIVRQRGRGTFPQPPAQKGKKLASPLLKTQLSLAKKTRIEILAHGLVRPAPALAATFAMAADQELLRIERIRRDDRSPISHTLCYLPAELAHFVPRAALSSLPVSATLAQAGVELADFDERITAVLADTALAGHLDVDVGTPLLAMTRKVRDKNGRLVEVLQARYRPDRYEYHVEYALDDEGLGAHWKAMITDSENS